MLKNLNFSLFALMACIMQIVTGILLVMFYTSTVGLAFIIIEHIMRDIRIKLSLYIKQLMWFLLLFFIALLVLPAMAHLEGWSGNNVILEALSGKQNTNNNAIISVLSPKSGTEASIDTSLKALSNKQHIDSKLLAYQKWIFLKYKPNNHSSVAGLIGNKIVGKTIHDAEIISKALCSKNSPATPSTRTTDINYNNMHSEKMSSISEVHFSRGARFYFNSYKDYLILGNRVKGFKDNYFFLPAQRRADIDGFLENLVPVTTMLSSSTHIPTEITNVTEYADTLIKVYSELDIRINAVLAEFQNEISLMTSNHANSLSIELKHLRYQCTWLSDYINCTSDTLYPFYTGVT